MHTARIVLIGNELLSGKIQDANASWLAGRLRELGVQLRRVVMIPDEPEIIAREIREAAADVDHVFTSGGVGPTHDDITLSSIASAFNVPLVSHPRLQDLIREHFGERLQPDHLRMAAVPQGITLIDSSIHWPVMVFRNIYILPGVPEIFRLKFNSIAEQFRSGRFLLRSIYLKADEGELAQRLAQLETDFKVVVGSYPKLKGPYKVRITIEARTPEPVNAAVDALLGTLEAKEIVEVDPVVE